jgi:uncharacterized membrane protein YkoI
MKRNIVIATVTAAALLAGGTVAAYAVGGDDDKASPQGRTIVRVADDDRDDTADDRDDATETRGETRTAKVAAADAIAAALKHTPGTAVTADLDDDGATAWEVDVIKGDGTEYGVQVSPTTGKVLGAHRDDDGDDDGRADLAALKGSSVDAREATQAAASKGTVTEVGLDEDGPDRAWEAETRGSDGVERSWRIDLRTGTVTADRSDDD